MHQLEAADEKGRESMKKDRHSRRDFLVTGGVAREERAIIVTTVDSTHDRFIIDAMEAGCDVITEKPLTTDEAKCQAILDVQERTGREITVTGNFGETELLQIPHSAGGHGGGDTRMQDAIFRNPGGSDPYRQTAGVRDGAMAVLLGIAARKSGETAQPVRIADLTTLVPKRQR